MIGYITTPEVSAQISAAVREAQISRGIEPYLAIHGFPVTSGEHAGLHFLPFEDAALTTPLHANTRLTDYPEFTTLIAMLGGLEARIDLLPEAIAQPEPEL
jgi:hypothetical protein